MKKFDAKTHARVQQSRLVLIGGSAGGLDAIKTIFGGLQPVRNASYVIVLHFPPNAEGATSVIAHFCSFKVEEAQDKLALEPGVCYVAPPGYHTMIENDLTFSLSLDPPEHYSRPSIDVLFESGAIASRQHVTAALLTGSNEDGAQGLATVKRMGGTVIVQDPKTSEFRTMPEAGILIAQPELILTTKEIHEMLQPAGGQE